jgi:hypothetical protein
LASIQPRIRQPGKLSAFPPPRKRLVNIAFADEGLASPGLSDLQITG